MIDWLKSAKLNNTTVEKLKARFEKYPNSGKRVVAICDECYLVRNLRYCEYSPLCHYCALQLLHQNLEWIKNNKIGRKNGKTRHNYEIDEWIVENQGKHFCHCGCCGDIKILRAHFNGGIPKYIHGHNGRDQSDVTCKKLSDSLIGREVSKATRDKISDSLMGHGVTEETRKRISASGQGVSYNEWDGFVKPDQEYCDKFDETCRESNREKYGRYCFLCGKDEDENNQKLCVHHVDLNKDQGCNDHDWKLIPLCRRCHGRAHSELWIARIEWLLSNISNWR